MGNCQKPTTAADVPLPTQDTTEWQKRLDDLAKNNKEVQNMLKYKMEVLLHLLSVEEQKNEMISKRLDAVKLILLNHGVTEQGISSLVANTRETPMEQFAYDLSAAIEKMSIEFQHNKNDIIYCFADDSRKIISHTSVDNFVRNLYTCTEKISKTELKLLAYRFLESSRQVSVIEFLEFFTMSQSVRTTRSAMATVRMSRQILEIDTNQDTNLDSLYKSHTDINDAKGVEKSILKLELCWKALSGSISTDFEKIGNSQVNASKFQEILINNFKNLPLQYQMNNEDARLITAKYEIGGMVDHDQFMNHINDSVRVRFIRKRRLNTNVGSTSLNNFNKNEESINMKVDLSNKNIEPREIESDEFNHDRLIEEDNGPQQYEKVATIDCDKSDERGLRIDSNQMTEEEKSAPANNVECVSIPLKPAISPRLAHEIE